MNSRISRRIVVFISFALVVSTLALGQPQKSDDDTPAAPPVPKLDINLASKDQLMKQLGLTEALSIKIITGRPYLYKSDLVERKILTDAVYARITDLITVKTAKR